MNQDGEGGRSMRPLVLCWGSNKLVRRTSRACLVMSGLGEVTWRMALHKGASGTSKVTGLCKGAV